MEPNEQTPPRVKFTQDPITPEEKLKFEIAKLRAEHAATTRPLYYNPAIVIAMVTALATTAGALYQIGRSTRQFELAEIKRERALLELSELQQKRIAQDTALKRLSAQYAATSARVAQEEERLTTAAAELRRLQNFLQANQTVAPGLVAAVAQATDAVQAASSHSEERAIEAGNVAAQVEGLRGDLRAPARPDASDRRTAVVTGGFGSVDQARRDADSTRARGYMAHVYQRNGKARTAILFLSRDSARKYLPQIRASVRRSAYLVDWNEWCPGASAQQGVYTCLPSEPEKLVH
jgi:flagellar biosynthesis chaperone FliJ